MSTTNSTLPANGIGGLPFTPMHGPNAFFLSFFVIAMAVQCVLAVLFGKRWYGYSIGMLCGLLLETLGYAAKLMLSSNRFDKDGYIMYIIGLTLGPTFLSSSLYLGISALQRSDKGASRIGCLGPRLLATLFILGDFICLCFIGVGGSLAAIFASSPVGVDLMIAGLATQVLFTSIFCLLLIAVYRRTSRGVACHDQRVRYMILVGIAAACLFIRSCWRVAELSGGFNGRLASKERIFIALDSIPMVIMSMILTVVHPHFWFGSGSASRPTSTKNMWISSSQMQTY